MTSFRLKEKVLLVTVACIFSTFLQDLQDCRDFPAKVGRCFINRVSTHTIKFLLVAFIFVCKDMEECSAICSLLVLFFFFLSGD